MTIHINHNADGTIDISCGMESVRVVPAPAIGTGQIAPLPTGRGGPINVRPIRGGPGPMALIVLGKPHSAPDSRLHGITIDLEKMSHSALLPTDFGLELKRYADALPSDEPAVVTVQLGKGAGFDVGGLSRRIADYSPVIDRPLIMQIIAVPANDGE